MAIEDQFMRVLGRAPRPDEVAYFQKFINDGDLSEYEIGEILGGTPEAQGAMFRKQGEEYAGILARGDEDMLNRAQDSIRSDFYQAGRPASSGYLGAYSQAARDLAMARQGQMAGYYGRGFPGLQEQGIQQAYQSRNRGAGLRDERRQRAYQIEDYYRQKNDYESFMKSQDRRGFGRKLLGAGIQMAGTIGAGYAGGLGLAAGLGARGLAAAGGVGGGPMPGYAQAGGYSDIYPRTQSPYRYPTSY